MGVRPSRHREAREAESVDPGAFPLWIGDELAVLLGYCILSASFTIACRVAGQVSPRSRMAKMTKSQFITVVAEKTGHAKKDISTVLDTIASVSYDTVKKLGEVTIPGLGKLVKKHRPARMGRNPATGEAIKIAAKTVVRFRVAKAAKDAIL